MKKKTPAQPSGPQIPAWRQRADSTVEVVRDASFWRSAGRGAVDCLLCYKQCTLQPGELGWCKARKNERGRLVLTDHGVMSRCQRLILGYRGGSRMFWPGALALGIGGIHCTARCSFCTSAETVWNPAALGWLGGRNHGMGLSGGWKHVQAMLHPSGVLSVAQQVGARVLVFAENEPMLNWEYLYDTCRLAKAAGLRTLVYTNGFSTPAAIRKLAGLVDAIDLGIKSPLDPDFYARYMRSPGAVEHVKAAALAWREIGADVLISHVVATQHQLPESRYVDAEQRCYAWIAEQLGEHTPILIGVQHPPDPVLLRNPDRPLVVRDSEAADYMMRFDRSREIAQAAGLHYAHLSYHHEQITCHACDALLLQLHKTDCAYTPCAIHLHYCACWSHTQGATAGHCDACGVAVPLRTLSAAELEQDRATAAAIAEREYTAGIYDTRRNAD